jgi:hypothetical protein
MIDVIVPLVIVAVAAGVIWRLRRRRDSACSRCERR